MQIRSGGCMTDKSIIAFAFGIFKVIIIETQINS